MSARVPTLTAATPTPYVPTLKDPMSVAASGVFKEMVEIALILTNAVTPNPTNVILTPCVPTLKDLTCVAV